MLATAGCSSLGLVGLLDVDMEVSLHLLLGLSSVVMNTISVKWGDKMVTRGYYINLVDLRGHTAPSTCSQQVGSF